MNGIHPGVTGFPLQLTGSPGDLWIPSARSCIWAGKGDGIIPCPGISALRARNRLPGDTGSNRCHALIIR